MSKMNKITPPISSESSDDEATFDVAEKTVVPPSKIMLSLLNTLVGKDKIAKTAQYALRILLLYTKSFLGSKQKSLRVGKLNQILLVLCKEFQDRSTGVVAGLSLYRQLLRFGKTPFRVQGLYGKLKSSSLKVWQTEESLGDVIDLYYGVCDEILLLFKMGALRSGKLRQLAGKHEMYSWYYDIILGLKQTYCKLKEVERREMAIKIRLQVKQRAKKFLLESPLSPAQSPSASQIHSPSLSSSGQLSPLPKELIDIGEERRLLRIDLMRLMCDFSFNSVDIFNLKVPQSLYLLFGLTSGSLGLTKAWIAMERQLS